MNEILMARESRSLLVKEIHRGFPLLVIKANTPGTNKNSPQAFSGRLFFRNREGKISCI